LLEWDSVDDAVAFYKSKAWTDLAPQRDKVQKTIRRYVVEVENGPTRRASVKRPPYLAASFKMATFPLTRIGFLLGDSSSPGAPSPKLSRRGAIR